MSLNQNNLFHLISHDLVILLYRLQGLHFNNSSPMVKFLPKKDLLRPIMSVEPTKDGKKFVKTAEKTFRLVEQ